MVLVADAPLLTGTETAQVSKKKDGPLRQVNIRLAQDLHKRVEDTARSFGLDTAQFLRMLVKRHLPQYESEAEEIRAKESGR